MKTYKTITAHLLLCLTLISMLSGCDREQPTGEIDQVFVLDELLQYNPWNLNKGENWQRYVTDSPFYLESETTVWESDGIGYASTAYRFGYFPALNGSTVCIPMAYEFVLQHIDCDSNTAMDLTYFSTTAVAYEKLINREGNDYNGSSALESLREKPADLILVTQPSDDELRKAEAAGVELVIEPICWDAFVFITHKDNPVNSLTLEQIRGIYTGEITNWAELGGLDQEIAAYQREPNSGSQTAMEKQVMLGRPMTQPDRAKMRVNSMSDLVDAVSEYENEQYSIGYTFKFYINHIYGSESIKILEIGGVAPTDANIRSGEYPLVANYYAVYRAEDKDGVAGEFTEWILSEEGQKSIAQAGYITLR